MSARIEPNLWSSQQPGIYQEISQPAATTEANLFYAELEPTCQLHEVGANFALIIPRSNSSCRQLHEVEANFGSNPLERHW